MLQKGFEAVKLAGAVGTFANIPPEVEAYVCAKLEFVLKKSRQILPRDLHAVTFTIACNDKYRKICDRNRGLQNLKHVK